MGAKGYWAPQANLIARGKKTDLTPYPGNSLNKNLLSQSVKNPAHLIALSFSQERFMTHLPILAGFPPEEAIRLPKWLKSLSSTSRSSLERLISKGFSSPSTGRRKLLTTSSKVIVSSSTEKKNMWRDGHQRCTKCLRPLPYLKPSRFLKIATDFKIPARSKQLTNSPSESSLSTQIGQLVILPGTKSKKMGTASRDPHLIYRSKISLGS